MGDSERGPARRVAITGGTGMIGRALQHHLAGQGWEVAVVSRRPMPGGILWDPARDIIDAQRLATCPVVINLAGANIAGKRWTPARKAELISSRVQATRLLAETLAGIAPRPAVLISASAMGIYGDRGDEPLDEHATPGHDFLASLATAWEASAEPARDAGIRVVHPRFGTVLSPDGGALAKLLPPARLGFGGPIGNGEMWWSWIALSDLVRMIDWLITQAEIDGPVNAVSPAPVRQREFARILGRVLHRPAMLPLPAFVLRTALGEMADAALLASTRVVPARMLAEGFAWEYPELEAALKSMLR